MKNRLNPLAAAIAASLAFSMTPAFAGRTPVSTQPEIITDERTIIIENGVVVGNSSSGSGDARLAQASPDKINKQVRIITSTGDVDVPSRVEIDTLVSSAMAEAFASGAGPVNMKSVKNAPYSAEVVSEKIQHLPDGNQISKRTSSMTFRDSAGRTRQEVRDAKGELRAIHINDSVEGSRLMLSPSAKTATKITLDKDLSKQIEALKEKAKAMAKDGKATIIEHPGPGQEIIVKRVELPASDGKREVREDVNVRVVRAGGTLSANSAGEGTKAFHFSSGDIGPALAETMRAGPIGMTFQDRKWSSKANAAQLGTKEFEGVRAEGKSVTYTIPAGEIGNKNAITVTTETWYSPDLQATVYSKSTDPRVGETIYRLTNIKRSEQSPSLFTVPDGYTLKESSNTFNFQTK